MTTQNPPHDPTTDPAIGNEVPAVENSPYVVPLAEALAPIRSTYRELVDAAVTWQAGRERHTAPDAFTLICLGADHGLDDTRATRWTRTGVHHVMRCDIPNWCSLHRCLWPAQLAEAMWDWFDFLDETGRLDPASDPLCELRKPLLCYGGLDQRGRPLPEGAKSTVECECFLPYRETMEIFQKLARDAEYSGRDVLDPLRQLVGRPTRPPWWEGLDGTPGDELYGFGSGR